MAQGEVGKVGVSISSLEDMATLFDEIPLDKVSTSMTINAPAAILLAMYIAVAKRQGVGIQPAARHDPERHPQGIHRARHLYLPAAPSMRLITDIFRFCQAEVPHWNTISISGYHIREAGSTAVQEVAFTLANAIAYVQAALDAGLDVDGFAGQLSFFFNAHNNFLEEVAKFRAARRLWAKIMRERFKAQKPALVAAALPHPDRRLHADRPAAGEQRGARDAAGAGGRAGRDAVAAHQQHGRSPVAAHREIGARGAAHPADHRLRIGRGRLRSIRWRART